MMMFFINHFMVFVYDKTSTLTQIANAPRHVVVYLEQYCLF